MYSTPPRIFINGSVTSNDRTLLTATKICNHVICYIRWTNILITKNMPDLEEDDQAISSTIPLFFQLMKLALE